MTESEIIVKEIKAIHKKIAGYSEKAQLDSFLSYYDNSPDFLHFSSDGVMRNYEEFKKVCTEYYNALAEQTITTIREKPLVIAANLVVLGWTGDIIARFKNGDVMKMNSYSITNVFKKMGNKWKIIHSHESSVPPEIIKKK